MNRRQIHSVGIDIGTTTTQVIFSLLELVNRAGVSQVPRYEFSRRDIVYESPVAFTPLDADGRVREDELMAFIRAQYRAAGIREDAVESGAIIITGETSKARNARDAVLRLAETLGDFVVATAGPHLESAIAGHGSGACEMSAQETRRVANIDIGGGTANYAVFEAGRLVDTACLNVGGRLIETTADGATRHVHEPARAICADLFGDGVDLSALGPAEHERVAGRMAGLLWEVLVGDPSALARELLMTEPLRAGRPFDAVMISGGVGECYYRPSSAATPYAFHDIGPLLARALHTHEGMRAQPVIMPAQTLRATVIGAGAYTLSLSGSTIWLKNLKLPLRNIPVAHPDLAWADFAPGRLEESLERAVRRLDLDPGRDLYALALPADLPIAYRAIDACATELAGFSRRFAQERPLIVLSCRDLGKALGMLLQPALAGRELAVIDEVATRDGDYIDIGAPLFGGEIVPVTVKSLAFPSSKGM
ncbi:ethanolamine ammonia-lyase reactivating factor EutA [Paludibacterium paludis]|uniref:Ethanolamine utilization protein n=1 Tax=Paludibacterium paludis TaxID=1225769 RepID=A0A918NWW7_9NEIS|nr:ethanolamine ammonia-lyase reactivating factor EutA [Paludibacterium paludis]GGY02260.1 ethanolamine utilization protein [Paludibacterium paludis]